jgi:hypothetical protein
VGQDVHHEAARVADEEAAHAPLLVAQVPDDLGARRQDGGVHRVDVVDLDAQVGHHRRGALLGEEADLGGRVAG